MKTSTYFTFVLLTTALVVAKTGISSASLGVLAAFFVLAAIPLYFGTRDRAKDPSKAERFFATMWVWLRRLLGLAMGALCFLSAWVAVFPKGGPSDALSHWIGAGFLLFLGAFLFYFAAVGQGVDRYRWRDDVELHKQNKRRYRWWL